MTRTVIESSVSDSSSEHFERFTAKLPRKVYQKSAWCHSWKPFH